MIKQYLLHPDEASNTKKTLALSMASIMNICMNVVLQMLIARYLEKEEIAIYLQSLLVYNSLFPFLQLGITNGLYSILVRYSQFTRSIMVEGIVISFFACIGISTFIIFKGDYFLAYFLQNEGLLLTSYWLIPYFLVCVPESIAIVGFVYFNRIRFIAYYNALKSIVTVVLLLFIVCYYSNGYILFVSRVLISCLFGGSIIYLLFHYVLPVGVIHFRKEHIIDILIISVPLSFATMAGTISNNLDQWIISGMLGPTEYSVYQMGAYELPIIGIITGAISTVIVVDINKAVKQGDINKAMELFYSVAEKTSMILMPCMIFFFFAANDFICFLFTDRFIGAVPVFCVYLLYIPVRCVIYGPIFIALGKSSAILKRESLSLILNIILSIIFVKNYGMIGAAFATIATSYCLGVTYNLFSLAKWTDRHWHHILPLRKMGIYIFLSIPGGVSAKLIVDYFNSANYMLNLICMFTIFCAITIFLYQKILNIHPRGILMALRR